MTGMARTAGSRGGPLIMLVLLLTAWTGARAVWWENPFAALGPVGGVPFASAPPGSIADWVQSEASSDETLRAEAAETAAAAPASMPGLAAELPAAPPASVVAFPKAGQASHTGWRAPLEPQMALAHHLLWRAGMGAASPRQAGAFSIAVSGYTTRDRPPFLAPQAKALADAPAKPADAQRWSLDAWAFWRQGSGSAPTSQARTPIYGASQAGAVLQFRLAPRSPRDPRLHARAYRALVAGGENELALGASARPFAKVPLRAAAEARLTDTAFKTEMRPSAYAVTEFAPISLPFGAQLEAYGQAGWVGGDSSTTFADGQVSATREVLGSDNGTDNSLRLSIGAGAWGGAQDDAERIDLGPTMRLDVTVGQVPARLSVDWRERVGGDAGPDSGLAATISTRF